ncbi:hypothetical protein [Nocardia carnea]|uniref:hypothetical protein n=1 Tax=Nocardia carnea TaxID=37328 RepID=UPI00245743ED|nr:hypothetical protein [Nocardia carnea]
MRHIGRPPNLVRVVVLVFATVVLTLGLHDGLESETVSPENLSFAHSVIAAGERVAPAVSESAESIGQIVHCPYHCLRAPVVRPRASYFWYAAMSIVGLLLGGVCARARYARPGAARRTATGAAGAELLLRLCVCRR